MKTSDIIKSRRKELRLTGEQVAKAAGIPIATYYRYETDAIDKMPITVIPALAKALHCSESYLLGWNSNSSKVEEAIYINDNFKKLSEEDQKYINDLINRLANKR